MIGEFDILSSIDACADIPEGSPKGTIVIARFDQSQALAEWKQLRSKGAVVCGNPWGVPRCIKIEKPDFGCPIEQGARKIRADKGLPCFQPD